MKYTTILAATLTLAGASLAQAAALEEMDANGDGMVTLDEVQAMYPEIAAETFTAADANADGTLDAEELAAAEEAGLMPMSGG